MCHCAHVSRARAHHHMQQYVDDNTMLEDFDYLFFDGMTLTCGTPHSFDFVDSPVTIPM